VSNQDSNLIAKETHNALIEQMTANVRIDSRKRIIQQIDVCIVERSGQINSGFLPTA
jgi:hypothetical protein